MFTLTVYNNRGSSSYVPPPITPPSSGTTTTPTTGLVTTTALTEVLKEYAKKTDAGGISAVDVHKLIRAAGLWRRVNIVFPGTGDGQVSNQTDNDWHSVVVFRNVVASTDPPPTWVINCPSPSLSQHMTQWTNVDNPALSEPAPAGAWCYLINESVESGVAITFFGTGPRSGWQYKGRKADGSLLRHQFSTIQDVLPIGRAAILTCIRAGGDNQPSIFHYHVL